MQKYEARFVNGEQMEIWQLESGEWPCPICGYPWPYPPFAPAESESAWSSIAMGDVCEGCEVEFGVDFCVGESADAMRQAMKFLRTKYLDRVGWSEASLSQLKRNLGIDEAEARRQALELRGGNP